MKGVNTSGGGGGGIQVKWRLPPAGFIKVNTDAAIFENGDVGLGVVGRDEYGSVVFICCRRSFTWWEPKVAEAMAMRMGLELADRLRFARIVIESDSKQVVDLVQQGRSTRNQMAIIIEDLAFLKSSFNQCRWSHVKRDGNCVAHYVARLCARSGEEFMYVSSFPDAVLALAELDLI